jgi:putative transposase
VIDTAVQDLTPVVGAKAACDAVGRSRAGHYRAHPVGPVPYGPAPAPPARKSQPRALSEAEKAAVLAVLHSPRFVDAAPESIYATLLDEGTYLCSVATMYRVLRARGETGDRRRHASHPARVKPELVATQANQVWSWDITKLRGPAKWTYYYLYVIIDIYSRYVPGWMVASRESSVLAERMFAETTRKQGVARQQLTIHADNGSSMTSKPVAFLLADLGITKTHSRPHVSNDNPYSESQFRTLKYRPDFPDRFTCIEESRVFCGRFFPWYNHEHPVPHPGRQPHRERPHHTLHSDAA